MQTQTPAKRERREYMAQYYAANREKKQTAEYARRHVKAEQDAVRHASKRAADPEGVRAKERARYAANIEGKRATDKRANAKHRAAVLAGIAAPNVKGMPKATRPAPPSCEACSKPFDISVKQLSPRLDHDHTTGAFRGWICMHCNSSLGLAGDTIQDVRNLLAYLERAACE